MTYKVGDLVYFDDGVQKGVGTVSRHMDIMNHYQVHSTQIIGRHDGYGFAENQDNDNNWWFNEDDLKPFTKKEGQKYKVISNENNGLEIGDIVTLSAICDDGVSRYKEDGVGNYMYDLDHSKCEVEFYADVEDVKEHKEKEMFTRDDLKVGYLVKLRNGEFAHVVNTEDHGLCLNYENSWDTFRNYNNDLTNTQVDSLDIVEVYGYTLCGYEAHKFEVDNRELLWEREEVKEMTIEDIQKVLGHKIKVVE